MFTDFYEENTRNGACQFQLYVEFEKCVVDLNCTECTFSGLHGALCALLSRIAEKL